MRMLKELAIAAPILFLLFFLTDSLVGPAATQPDASAGRNVWVGAELIPAERFLFNEPIVTGASWQGTYPALVRYRAARSAAVRVKDVFAQFVPGDGGRQG